MKKRIIPLIVLAAVIVGGYYVMQKNRAVEDKVFSGTVEATEVKVSAEIAGRVLEVNADEGDRVKADQLLVRIDHKTMDAQLAQAEAAKISAHGQYRALGATVDEVKVNLGRSENLFEGGTISEQKRDAVKAQKDVLDAQRQAAFGQIKGAEATGDLVRTQIEKATIYSPISGYVLKRAIEPGELTMPGTTLFDLADLENCWVRIYIPETRLGRVKIGQKAKIFVDSFPGKFYEGRVVTISEQAEFTPKNVQTKEERVRLVYAVKVDVKNASGELKIGMPVDAELVE